jgi:hypothetical protein
MKRSALMILLFVLGCDMADYQRRMDESRARLRIFDEDNRHLGKALDVPKFTVKVIDKEESIDAWPVDMFLRLPRGVSSTGEPFGAKESALFKYAGDPVVYVAVAGMHGEKEKSKEKRDDGPRRPTPEEFRERIKATFQDFMRGDAGGSFNWKCEETSAKTVTVPAVSAGAERKLTFDTFQCEAKPAAKEKEALNFSFFHYQAGDHQVLFVFQYAEGKKDQKTIELCLRSLGLDAEAVLRRREFAKMNPKK